MKVEQLNSLKALYSFSALLICLAIGYLVHYIVGGLPPALYGLIVLTLSLKHRLIRADFLEQTTQWIFRHMGVCFVPAGVGIIEHYELVARYGVTMVLITFVTTMILLTLVGLWVNISEKRPAP